MKPAIVLSLDFGTTFCKCAAHDGTAFIAFAQRPITVDCSTPGTAVLHPEDWKTAAVSVLKEVSHQLGDRTKDILAIGVATSGPGIILSDKNGTALLPSPNWQDSRCAAEGQFLFRTIGTEWVGQGLPETSLAARVLWYDRHFPSAFQSAARVQDNKGYILSFLTGNRVSDISCSGRAVHDWTKNLFDLTALRSDQLDTILPIEGIAGSLLPSVAEASDLPCGIPVVAGLNDGAAAVLGTGELHAGVGISSISTNGVVRILTKHRPPSDLLAKHGFFCTRYVEDLWVLGGFTKSAGDTLAWLGETWYSEVPSEARLDALTADAVAAELGASGLRFIPGLHGLGSPHPSNVPSGAFFNIARCHKRNHFSRAVFEGLSFSLREVGDTICGITEPWSYIHCTGGGTKNRFWLQMLADVMGCNVRPSKADSILGCAIVAAKSIGLFSTYEDAVNAMVSPSASVINSSTEHHEAYDRMYTEYIAYVSAIVKK